MTDAMAALPERRRDEFTDWHDVVRAECELCTCTQHRAVDDPEIRWEPGRAWDAGCTDRTCRCHTDSVAGGKRD